MSEAMNVSPADQILNIDEEDDVYGMISNLTRQRRLSRVVHELNQDVLQGREPARRRAIAALDRMGLWME